MKVEECTYTFWKDNKDNSIGKYQFCQRPCNSNMSLRKFEENGEIIGYMSETLAKINGLEQISLNEFIFKFVQPLVKENIELKKLEQSSTINETQEEKRKMFEYEYK